MKATYKDAGVDIDAGDELVQAIKPLCRSTQRLGADTAIGGFGSLFDLKGLGYKDPLLVAGTDGVGTKLRVAILTELHDTVGIDLVAMSVNDILVQGAEPLFFLDYYATGKLDVASATTVIKGIAEGCRQSGCALIGGETAEMPSMYAPGDYDLAGFAVGIVERDQVLPRLNSMKEGDVILGLASSGIHSNGFSLIRHLVTDFLQAPPFQSEKSRLCDELLTPTRIYVKSLLPIIKQVDSPIKGLAHITGGGLPENLPRILPPHLQATINLSSWEVPPVFQWLQTIGSISQNELLRTFNCGIGMVVICSQEMANSVALSLAKNGEKVYSIGVLSSREVETAPVVFTNSWGVPSLHYQAP